MTFLQFSNINRFSEPYVKNFPTEESPSGMVARSGTYNVRSRVIDDDKEVYAGSLSIILFKWIIS